MSKDITVNIPVETYEQMKEEIKLLKQGIEEYKKKEDKLRKDSGYFYVENIKMYLAFEDGSFSRIPWKKFILYPSKKAETQALNDQKELIEEYRKYNTRLGERLAEYSLAVDKLHQQLDEE